MNELKGLQHYLDSISKNNFKIECIKSQERAGNRIYVSTVVDFSDYELIRDGHKIINKKIQELRNNLLNSDLFYQERKDLQEYEKLKDMKFVLDALKELDLSSIKETKKEPEFFDTMKALKYGVKNG